MRINDDLALKVFLFLNKVFTQQRVREKNFYRKFRTSQNDHFGPVL